MSNLVSASRRKLLRECHAFTSMPWFRRENGYSADGTEAHRVLQVSGPALSHAARIVENPRYLRLGVPQATSTNERAMELVMQVMRGIASSGIADAAGRARDMYDQGGRVLTEAAFAFNPTTMTWRLLCTDKSREEAYALKTDGELFTGTVDLVVIVPGEPAIVVDYKTTWSLDAVVDAEAQIKAGCQAVSDVFAQKACRGVQLSATTVDFQPTQWLWDSLELAEEDGLLAEDIRASFAEPPPAPTPGDHCRWCPAKGDCPEYIVPATALVRHAKPELVEPEQFKLTTQLTSPEHAAWQLKAVQAATEVLDVLKDAVKSYVDEHGAVDMGNGYEYRKVHETREEANLDSMKAAELVISKAPRAVKMKASWSDIERAAGKEAAKEIREELRTMGALRLVAFDKYTPVKRKKEK